MSISESSALRLLDAKRIRIKAERDAELLASRVKLLQAEEARLKKQTDEKLKEQQRLEAIRKRNEDRVSEKARHQADRNRKLQEAKQVIGHLKVQHERERGRMQEVVWKLRSEAGREGREMRTMSLQYRYEHKEAARLENYKKSEAVRREKIAKTRHLESFRSTQIEAFHEDYVRRVAEEEEKFSQVNKAMLQLEELEAQLIDKLKDSIDRSSRITGRSNLLGRTSPSSSVVANF